MGQAVMIQLSARRFRYLNIACIRKTVAERLDDATMSACRTKRLGDLQRHLGLAFGSEAGTRLAEQLKQELGLGHYEGRGWRGFHHHATLCIAAYGYLVSEQGAISPRKHAPPLSSRNIAFPKVTDPADPSIRPERHVEISITTIRIVIAQAIARNLLRCRCC